MVKTKIIGNTTATPVAIPDFKQVDARKADYIKNKPTKLSEFENDLPLGDLASKDTVSKTDLSSDVQASLNNADTVVAAFSDIQEITSEEIQTLFNARHS